MSSVTDSQDANALITHRSEKSADGYLQNVMLEQYNHQQYSKLQHKMRHMCRQKICKF
jgi:hypothetical protein